MLVAALPSAHDSVQWEPGGRLRPLLTRELRVLLLARAGRKRLPPDAEESRCVFRRVFYVLRVQIA